jgi:hypothetical protein
MVLAIPGGHLVNGAHHHAGNRPDALADFSLTPKSRPTSRRQRRRSPRPGRRGRAMASAAGPTTAATRAPSADRRQRPKNCRRCSTLAQANGIARHMAEMIPDTLPVSSTVGERRVFATLARLPERLPHLLRAGGAAALSGPDRDPSGGRRTCHRGEGLVPRRAG